MNPLNELIRNYPELDVCAADIQQAFELLQGCFHAGGKLLVCGNGGSAADAEHIVGELMKGYMLKRRLPGDLRTKFMENDPVTGPHLADHLQSALPAISLVSQTALITAFANDVDPALVYAQQVLGYGRTGDVLFAISTSGTSHNILYALQTARTLGLRTIGLTGPTGGKLKSLCDVTICAPGMNTPAIQEHHLPIYHALCAALEAEFFN